MIEYVATNLFESPAQTLVNTVNTVGVMGKGIANDFRRLYPEMFERYRAFCSEGRFRVGQLYLYRTSHKWVLNFPTKVHWRNPSKLEWIEAGLSRFVETYSEYGITSVSFPQLGTGNGGLEWETVRPVMERYLKQARIPVYVHIRPRDPNFIPEHIRSSDIPALSRDLHEPRREIAFETFLSDLKRIFAAQELPREQCDFADLSVKLGEHGADVVIPGENVLDFWQALRLRGAIELDHFPGVMNEHAAFIAHKIVATGYIKPMAFGAERRPGLRYAPPRNTVPPAAPIEVHPE